MAKQVKVKLGKLGISSSNTEQQKISSDNVNTGYCYFFSQAWVSSPALSVFFFGGGRGVCFCLSYQWLVLLYGHYLF